MTQIAGRKFSLLQIGMILITIFAMMTATFMYVRQIVHDDIHKNNIEHHGKKSIFRSNQQRNIKSNNNHPESSSSSSSSSSSKSSQALLDAWISETLNDIKSKKNKYQDMLTKAADNSHVKKKPVTMNTDKIIPKETMKPVIHPIPNPNLGKVKLHAVTYASHGGRDDRFCRAIESALRNDIDIIILGWGVQWKGLSQKLEAAYHYAKSLSPNDVVLFTDAFDILYTQSATTILDNFLQLNSSILFSAECGCWPHVAEDPNICLVKYPKSPTSYRYLNSGTWIGYAQQSSEMLKVVMEEAGKDFDNANDQKLIADLFIAGRFGITLDYHARIFQAMHMTLDPPLAHCDPSKDIIEKHDEQHDNRLVYFNQQTKSIPGVFHFNGGGKQHHLHMESQVWYKDRRFNQPSQQIELKNRYIQVPTNPHGKLTFDEICPGYVSREYNKK